ncbi:MAG: hypothetical protein MJZ30_06265 [Paludibacteraceae bacterium]|nr:hypothetical protein [Paludibacteraceae bacterium]
MELTARLKKITEKYDLDPEDVIYCDLTRAGWGKFEAIFYAYHLSYFDVSKINIWMRDRQKLHPGIAKLLIDYEEEDKEERKKIRELEEKVKSQKKRASATKIDADSDKMTKEELGRMYVQIMKNPNADDKSKMEASKAYTQLYQLQKEQDKDEDNRLNFYLPANCHYCDRCRDCELKTELEKRGCKIRAKKSSPFLWEVVDEKDADKPKQ